MSDDRILPFRGASDDGPGDTPLEQLLREALTARADQISAHDLRLEAPPARRVRRTRPLYTVALPLVALAAAASIGYLGFQGSPVAKQVAPAPAASVTTGPTPSPSAASPSASTSASGSASASSTAVDPAAGQSGSAAASTSAAAGTPYTFQGVTFQLPAGWTAKPMTNHLCVAPPGAPQSPVADCEPYGVSFTVFTTADEVRNPSYPAPGDVEFKDAWAHQPSCFSWDNPHSQDRSGQTETQQTTGYNLRVETLAGHQAREATWNVSCASGDTFTARRWDFVPQQVFINARGLKASYEGGLQSILHSLDLSGVHNGDIASAVVDQAPLRRDFVGGRCATQQTPQTDPAVAVAAQVLTAAQTRDYATLTQLYQATPGRTAQQIADQKALWQRSGTLEHLARVLVGTHYVAPASGYSWPSFAGLDVPGCLPEQADLALFDVAKASDYHGVVTSVSVRLAPGGAVASAAWNGVEIR